MSRRLDASRRPGGGPLSEGVAVRSPVRGVGCEASQGLTGTACVLRAGARVCGSSEWQRAVLPWPAARYRRSQQLRAQVSLTRRTALKPVAMSSKLSLGGVSHRVSSRLRDRFGGSGKGSAVEALPEAPWGALHLIPATRVLPSQGPARHCSPGDPLVPHSTGQTVAEPCKILNPLSPSPGSCFRQL